MTYSVCLSDKCHKIIFVFKVVDKQNRKSALLHKCPLAGIVKSTQKAQQLIQHYQMRHKSQWYLSLW